MNRKAFLQVLGPLPPKVGLRARLLEQVDCGSYVREKVEYTTEPGERVRAYLLLPKAAQRLPAVFCHHQHASNWDLGKSEVVGLAGDPDQAYAKELAERGFVTFAPDAIAFEERKLDKDGRWGNYCALTTRLVRGTTLLGKVLHDISVGIDYLQSRRETDPARIGFLGHSYGGRMAIWAAAFDKRIIAAVSHCGCVNYKDSFDPTTGIQMEFVAPGVLKKGDIEDVVRLIEPNKLLLSATTRDKYSKGARKIYNYARPAFKKGTLKLQLYPGNHVFTPTMRTHAYRFLEQHLAK